MLATTRMAAGRYRTPAPVRGGVTVVESAVLVRLIAAARMTGKLTWSAAVAEATGDVAAIWGDGEVPPAECEINTEVLVQLMASASDALGTGSAAAGAWAVQVVRDLGVLRELVGGA